MSPPRRRRIPGPPPVRRLVAVCAVVGLVVVILAAPGGPAGDARIALVVFVCAVALWVGTRVDDVYVALGAALALVLGGVVGGDVLFAALGSETVWLLVAAFVLSAGVAATGLTARCAAALLCRARTVRQMAHLVAIALLFTAFAVPSTSGRAALAVPVFTALARAVGPRARVVRAFAVLFPTVILLTAVATLLGAGAHLVTNDVLATTTGRQIGFAHWLLLGVPLAVVSAHIAAELVLRLFTTVDDRSTPLRISVDELASGLQTPVTGPLSGPEVQALVVLGGAVAAWSTGPLHGAHPALVALVGALVITTPRFGTTTMSHGLRTVPWSLLVFMAATAVLGTALATSGAAGWLAEGLFGALHSAPPWVVVGAIVLVSVAAHLCIQSRTARSSVLIPLVIPVAIGVGLNPVAVAFASTAAAGFCHTLTSSAKPVAMFSAIDGVETYSAADLLRLSAWLAPITGLLVTAFAVFVWPHLGLPLT
ncbi:SLC13 family permease [Gordonia sp. (in: high G+C Gram-positive bacteria)]|uniref:SLC13 family permease n=1 Tax=Gordonia sp. (in: high G+C Gram-positive bacteria) TaxID=84139 RepID=UPI0025B9C0F3|nr:SLC13 family permease [Gordonia sp. (in: high G+C Gram-positive bacteria)]